MLYIYVAKSGDLSLDFANQKLSDFFTICVMTLRGQRNDRAMSKAVNDALRRNDFTQRNGKTVELEGNSLSLAACKSFYKSIKETEFCLYTVTLDKRKVCSGLSVDKDRIYSYIAGLAFKGVDFKDKAVKVTMSADKLWQGKEEIPINDYLRDQIQGWVNPAIPLDILRVYTQESPGLQATALFARGLQMKHEGTDFCWYSTFNRKVIAERFC